MSKCSGLHCPGCGDGGGGIAVVLVVLAVIIAAIARPVAHAAGDVLRVAAEVLEVTAITAASIAGLAVLGAAAYGARRAWRWHARNRQAITRQTLAGLDGSEALRAAQAAVLAARRPAIEAPRKVIPLTVITGKSTSTEGRKP
jgi:hypothetical protein